MSDRFSHVLSLLLPFFIYRPPQRKWQQHVVAGTLASAAIAACVFAFSPFARTESIVPQHHGHTNVSVEEAINYAWCGRYGYMYTGPSSPLTLAPSNIPIPDLITSKYGSISKYCELTKWHLNNENGPFLVYSFLMLRKGSTLSDLAFGMVAFRFVLLFAALYFLALWGLGAVPLALIGFGVTYVLDLAPGPQLMSVYPGLAVMLLFTSAVVASAASQMRRSNALLTAASFTVVGVILGFVFSYRTTYGVTVAIQVALAVATSMFWAEKGPVEKMRPRTVMLRYVASVLCLVLGFVSFHLAFIRPLERDVDAFLNPRAAYGSANTNVSYHTWWHTVVLGLANPKSELADREGIEWADPAGLKIAQKLRPDMKIYDLIQNTMGPDGARLRASPEYERILEEFYFDLWTANPYEMISIYANKIFQLSGTMPLAGSLLHNGYGWFLFIFASAICGLLYLGANLPLGLFVLSMTVGVALISIEQLVVMPPFTVEYQGSLLAGFLALLVMFVSYPLIYLISKTQMRVGWRESAPLLIWLLLAILPWAAHSIPPPPELYTFSISPLQQTNWALIKPARRTKEGIAVQGVVPFAGAYAAVSPPYFIPKGARVAAAGSVSGGGLSLGLLDSNDRWAATVAVPLGRFRTFVESPAEGAYRIVISSNLPRGAYLNDANVREVGFAGPNAAALRATAEQSASFEIKPIFKTAWQLIPPAQLIGQELRVHGTPPHPAAYAAVSTPFRLPKGARVAAAGTVRQGGIVLGLLDSHDKWAVTTAVPQGTFRVAIEAPVEGEYKIVIANNLSAGHSINDVEVLEVGLVDLDPATLRVAPPRSIP
jgi:hypothetical protein